MTSPQPPSGDDQPPNLQKPPPENPSTYRFHDEELDFDPYRFGRPDEPPQRAGVTGPAGPVAPGQNWNPGGQGPPPPSYAPGDYWGAPPPNAPPSGNPYGPPPGSQPGPPPTGRSPFDAPPGYSAGPPPGGAYPSGDPHGPPPGNPYGPPPGNPYGPPPGAPYGGPPPGNGLAVAGFVLGLLSLLLFLTTWPAVVLGILGLVFAVIGRSRAKQRGGKHRGLAIAGIILSVIGIIASSVYLAYVLSRVDFSCFENARGDLGQAQECIK